MWYDIMMDAHDSSEVQREEKPEGPGRRKRRKSPTLSTAIARQTDERITSLISSNQSNERGIHEGQQERHAVKTETHTGAFARVQAWLKVHEERMLAQQRTTDGSKETPKGRALVVVPNRSGALVGGTFAHLPANPLEEIRKMHGLEQERAKVLDRLKKFLRLKRGMTMLDTWTQTHLGKPCQSMEDVQRFFPHLTTTELSFFPLLENIPETFLLHGTRFDALAVKRADDRSFGVKEGLTPADLCDIPCQLELRADGIAYGTDRTNVTGIQRTGADDNDDEEDDQDSDTNPLDKEIVCYHPDVAKDIQRLIALTIENPRLLEKLKEQTTDALTVGVGLVQKEALARMRRKAQSQSPAEDQPQSSDADHVSETALTLMHQVTSLSAPLPGQDAIIAPLRELLESLDQKEGAAFQAEEQGVAEYLMRAEITDTAGHRLSLQSIIHLLGLLESIPTCLLQELPFRGKAAFYLDRILFVDMNDTIQEECPLSRECRTTVQQVIGDEMQESSSRNRTAVELDQLLLPLVQSPLVKGLDTVGDDAVKVRKQVSQAEATAYRTFKKYGITLRILPDRAMMELGKKGEQVSGGTVLRSDIKIGAEETEQYAEVLDRLGSALLQHVKQIRKIQILKPEGNAIMANQIASVAYNPETNTISIFEPCLAPYSFLKPGARHERSFLLAFAVGQSLWHHLPFAKQKHWERFFRACDVTLLKEQQASATSQAEFFAVSVDAALGPESRGPHLGNCLTALAMESEEADFATHFACFVLCQNEFKMRAEENRVVADKYTSIQELIAELTGKTPDFSVQSGPVAQMVEGLRQQFTNLPDLSDFNALIAFMQRTLDQDERRKEEPGSATGDESGPPTDLSEADENVQERIAGIVNEVESALEAVYGADIATMDQFDELCQEIAEALMHESGESAEDAVQEILEQYDALEGYSSVDPEEDDPHSAVIGHLQAAGLIDTKSEQPDSSG